MWKVDDRDIFVVLDELNRVSSCPVSIWQHINCCSCLGLGQEDPSGRFSPTSITTWRRSSRASLLEDADRSQPSLDVADCWNIGNQDLKMK